MKIFYWPASTSDGCFLYRIEMVAEALAARGHEIHMDTRVNQWARDEAQIWVGQRVCMPAPTIMWQELAQAGEHRLVFELDDDLFAIDVRQNKFAATFKDPAIVANLIRNIQVADLVTVSTEPLAEVVGRYNRNVVVLPNSIRSTTFDIKLPGRRGKPLTEAGGKVMLGWQGSATHEEDWKVMGGAVADLLGEDPALRMRFLGTFHPAGMTIGQFDLLPWTQDLVEHYRRVARFDIGLAPLNATTFNRSKSALRFIEGAALGVPMVCSRVPAYQDAVRDGETGFLVKNPAEWRDRIRLLAADHELRQHVGDQAREAALDWTIEARVKLWEDAYASLL